MSGSQQQEDHFHSIWGERGLEILCFMVTTEPLSAWGARDANCPAQGGVVPFKRRRVDKH